MKIIWKLTFAQIRRSRIRLGLSLLAMTAAAALIVWLMGSYDAMIADFDDEAEAYMGEAQWVLSPTPPNGWGFSERKSSVPKPFWISEGLISAVGTDPAVMREYRAVQTRVSLVNAKEWQPGFVPMRRQIGPPRDPMLVGISAERSPFEMVEGRWFSADSQMEGVLGSAAAERLGIHSGDSVYINSTAGDFFVTVSGLVNQSKPTPGVINGGGRGSLMPSAASLFVSTATAARINGYSGKTNLLYLVLHPESDKHTFRSRWANQMKQASCALIDGRALCDSFSRDRSVSTLRAQAYSTTGVALLSTLFIIFTTLSMGISERIRQLAILRAIGLTRLQLGGLILGESLMLAIPAWILGVGAGTVLVTLLHSGRSGLGSVAALSTETLLISAGATLSGALLAAVLPMIQAMKIAPLDAMKPQSAPMPRSAWRFWGLLIPAAFLIAVNPLLIWIPGIELEERKLLYAAVGYPALAVGFLCLTPMLICLCEWIFVPLTARLLGFNARFLNRTFSGNLWRTVGTAAALTIGLSLYTSFQFWGYSMAAAFQPDESIPDAVAVFTPSGVPDSEVENIRKINGINSESFLRVVGEQPKFAPETRAIPAFESVENDNMVLLGLDLQRAFLDSDPMFHFKFTLGSLSDAVERMRTQNGCLIPEGFQALTHLQLGDSMVFLNPNVPSGKVIYTVAGAVAFPGWHWMSKHSGLRKAGGFTAGMAFTARENMTRDFPQKGADIFWFNTSPGANLKAIESALQTLAEKYPGQPVQVPGVGEIPAHRPWVKVTGRTEIFQTVEGLADRAISAMSRMPLMILALAALAVINTLIASIRARRWELGVMRAVGLSRGMLLRMITAEALMIGLIACALSLLFGVVSAKCMIDICQYGFFFGGNTPSIQIPWGSLGFGFGFTLLLCLAASLIPALILARTTPLDLLDSSQE